MMGVWGGRAGTGLGLARGPYDGSGSERALVRRHLVWISG